MTDPSTVGFDSHGAFESSDEGFSLITIPFDSHAEVTDAEYRIVVRVPTRRVADAGGVTRATIDVPSPTVERDVDTVRIVFAFEHDDPQGAADAAKALAEFVEGTYVEGIVPGYTYEPPVADLLTRARQHGDEGGGDGSSGAMPL
ncbi:hypothetical protein BRD12_03395 [Halobacteriales archaeon SW_12_67_38]|nr:MAG: hypothetical protein BRD12_03395 [Halobacteriales archaeon SW_12_67_38]